MKQFFLFVVTILFFIWILPLGAFFKPSQARKACDGQRAICLCAHLIAKNKAQNQGAKIVNVSPRIDKGEGAGSASHDFILSRTQYQQSTLISFLLYQGQSLQQLLFSKEVEHVPKA